MLPNQTQVHSPAHSKANLLTPGGGEGKCSIYFRAIKEDRQLMLKRPKLPKGFQGKVFKDRLRGCFPGGAVVESLPASAGDMGSSPDLGRTHMPWGN